MTIITLEHLAAAEFVRGKKRKVDKALARKLRQLRRLLLTEEEKK